MLRTLSTLFILLQGFLVAGQGISLAEEYQNNSNLQWDWATESLRQFSFNPLDKILDVGCGDGKITALIASEVPNGIVFGLDISEKMIEQASQTFKNENLTFFQADAAAIPFKEEFDKVISFCALHWLEDQHQALNSMNDCLKRDGMMLLVLPREAPNNLGSVTEKIIQSEKWSRHFTNPKQERFYYTTDYYKELLIKARFEVQSIVETESRTFFENKKALTNWIKPLVTFIDHLDSNLQKEFIEDIADQMLLNDPPFHDSSICIRHIKMQFIAIKS